MEALRVGILDCLAGSDEVMLDAVVIAQLVEGFDGEFRTVVGADRFRRSVFFAGLVEVPSHAECVLENDRP